MGTKVYTESTCDRCGRIERGKGAYGELPPVGWSGIEITRRGEGEGWTNSTRQINGHICPSCTAAILACYNQKYPYPRDPKTGRFIRR